MPFGKEMSVYIRSYYATEEGETYFDNESKWKPNGILANL